MGAAKWPVLTAYDQDHLAHVAMPLGGIGTGTVSLGGRGDLRDWEIVNRPAKGFTPRECFFALRTQSAGKVDMRALEGLIEPEFYEGRDGCRAANHGLPRFREASFACAYPLGQVMLSDPAVPLKVRLEAFNPLVPADADASGIPVAVLRFVLGNPTGKAVKATVAASLLNFIGADGRNGTIGWADIPHVTAACKQNRNRFRRSGPVQGLYMDSRGVETSAEQWGTMALATTARTGVSCTLGRGGLKDFWADLLDDGRLTNHPSGGDTPIGALAVSLTVPPRSEKAVTFLLTWRYPNRMGWGIGNNDGGNVGNYYATQYKDAWDVAVRTAAKLADLERRTVEFASAVCDTPVPAEVKEAALYNISSLRTQTAMRTRDGRLFGWEGCCDRVGCCQGSCTHVWNYEHVTGFLFGDLAWTMREVEFVHMTRDDGFMNFRTPLPLTFPVQWGVAAADGQMGALMRLYREWQLSGDDARLKELWPKARKALEFAWLEKGWDPNKDGVMEGAQHHTLDIEYFGPNPLTGVWYLGALRACQEMAAYLGETAFAATCSDLFARGRAWLDKHLFNGEYYEHKVVPPMRLENTIPGLIWNRKRTDLRDPDMQLRKGCLCDQLVGQYTAHVCGLGYLLKKANVRKTYASLMKYNFREDFHHHLNISRGFALSGDKGLLMCTYPRGGEPKNYSGCYTECMTGFEYSAAIGMLQEGLTAQGLKCIKAIRDRYDGLTRSPFNEAECGHHYARAMAAWAALTTLTGFSYSGVTATMTLGALEGTSLWANGYAWGTCTQKRRGGKLDVELKVLGGKLKLSRLVVTGAGELNLSAMRELSAGKTMKKIV
ncbi:MAG: non-lysosomal glucosylceramidase [Planctomycetaceae bacterium]|nr:non-lysosomal glucosylceramidase [Planctomycetaceae bacterium]